MMSQSSAVVYNLLQKLDQQTLVDNPAMAWCDLALGYNNVLRLCFFKK